MLFISLLSAIFEDFNNRKDNPITMDSYAFAGYKDSNVKHIDIPFFQKTSLEYKKDSIYLF